MSSPNIGIYGGTFNPPHMGHIRAARAFLDACALDVLYILPTAVPPHKEAMAGDDPEKRLAMCRLAFAGLDERTVVSDYEQTRGGKSYTVLTLEHFRAQSENLFLLCGTDMFLTLDTWFRGDDILRMANICCLAREDDPAASAKIAEKARSYRERFGTHIILPSFTPLPISSTAVRAMAKEGQPLDGVVSASVLAYMKEHKLYE